MKSGMKTSILSALALIMASAGAAHAQTPPEVLKPFKEFRAAFDAGDHTRAEAAALTAWQEAEERLGDHKLTGRLASNYGLMWRHTEATKQHRDALERARDLAVLEDQGAERTYLERGVSHAYVLKALGKPRSEYREALALAEYAEANGLEDSTFYGETLTMIAGYFASKGNDDKSADYAQRAMAVFESASDNIATAANLEAALYTGYAAENEENHLDAALSYQQVMEATDGLEYGRFPLVDTALGRWIYMRSALRQQGKLEEAEQAGLCQCWPYDKPRKESVEPIERFPPDMPRFAQQSGYVVFNFDLDDTGTPTNISTITAWPDYYEEPAQKALEQWRYTEKAPGESDADRSDLVTTISFRLTDERGKMIW